MRRNNFTYMATYKKRGYKPKTKDDKRSAIEDQSTTAEVFNTLDEGASKTEEWVVKNQKYIFIIVALVAAVVLGSLGYKNFIQEPKESDAMNDMFQAQKYFDEAKNKQVPEIKNDVVVLIDTDSNYVCMDAVIKGLGITFIITGLMGIAFMGFMGIKL